MADPKIQLFLMFEGKAEEAMSSTSLCSATLKCSTLFAMGRAFSFTPAFSFFVDCESESEISRLYDALAAGGSAPMPIGNYGFSSKFAWVNDRYGVSWQLNLA